MLCSDITWIDVMVQGYNQSGPSTVGAFSALPCRSWEDRLITLKLANAEHYSCFCASTTTHLWWSTLQQINCRERESGGVEIAQSKVNCIVNIFPTRMHTTFGCTLHSDAHYIWMHTKFGCTLHLDEHYIRMPTTLGCILHSLQWAIQKTYITCWYKYKYNAANVTALLLPPRARNPKDKILNNTW